MKQATSISDQIKKLKERNVLITNEEKAREILLDIGYYRLGFYFFPFELKYPDLSGRDHIMKDGVTFEDAVALYYFDYDVRNILIQYTSRIEVAFRTFMTYQISNKYRSDPFWFVSEKVVSSKFVEKFDNDCYKDIRHNQAIRNHHKMHKHDKYAPSWKTLEFMTLGNTAFLYKNLLDVNDKLVISKHFGINQTQVFENYIEVVREIRNICAHGSVLYDAKLRKGVRKGPAGKVGDDEKFRLGGAVKVIVYLLGEVSINRQRDLIIKLNSAYEKLINKKLTLGTIIESTTQMKWNLAEISKLSVK